MSDGVRHPPRLRRGRVVAVLAGLAAFSVVVLLLRSRVSSADAPAPTRNAFVAADEIGVVPDDSVLAVELDKAIDLRRREDFDRMLDAREPGELAEHATLTEGHFDKRPLNAETIFKVGDELFGYLFRPENGWGAGRLRGIPGQSTPLLRSVHRGAAGGPDAFGCFSCHSKGGPDGAGTQTQNAFLRGDGVQLVSADQRNAPHLLGLGPVALLAREMSAELQSQAATALAQAKKSGADVEQPLTAKGVAFGAITASPSGSIDYAKLEGVDRDLTVRPFGWKGHQANLRDMAEESFHIHMGLLSSRIQLAVRDEGLDRAPYGQGKWFDVDEDGISLELDSGMLTTMVGYLSQLEVPVVRPPRDPGLLDAFAAGRTRFDEIGCANCHVPALELENPKFDARQPAAPETPPFMVDVSKDGDEPKIEPRYGGAHTSYLVHLFSDLKRHDMGPQLATPSAQPSASPSLEPIPASVFLTRSLWGLADTAPYLHDGRAPTIEDAILLHGGEASAARDAYLGLDEPGRASVRVFLTSLARQPKPFVP